MEWPSTPWYGRIVGASLTIRWLGAALMGTENAAPLREGRLPLLTPRG